MATDSKTPEKSVALITGATSGIGKAFAFEFARQQYDLIITGRRKEVINRVADELRDTFHINVTVNIADFTDISDMNRLLELLEKEDHLEVLVNNAGYGMGRLFCHDDAEHQLNMLKVHVNAPLMIIHKVLPSMIRNNRGIIINVSSMAAYIPTGTNSMYTSTKAFILNFSESLNLEVRRYGIRLQCLCPGFTHTDFHTKLEPPVNLKKRSLFVSWMEPAAVVKHSMCCLHKGKVICIPGFKNKMVALLLPIIPRKLYYSIINKLERESGFADNLKGEKPVYPLV